jgi:hypothetical protein
MVHGKTPFREGIAALKRRLLPYRDGFDVMAYPHALGCGESQTMMP